MHTWMSQDERAVVHHWFGGVYRLYRYRGPQGRPPYWVRRFIWGREAVARELGYRPW